LASEAGSRKERSFAGSRAFALNRLAWSFGAGILAFGIAIVWSPWQVATLIGWIVAVGIFVARVWLHVGRMDGAATASHATREDDSRAAADIILLASSTASLGGVAGVLLEAGGKHGAEKALMIAVASVAVVLSWAAVHTVYTLRYARLYYLDSGGIDFNDEHPPDYGDFGYFAFTIGMTYQVSDTGVRSRVIRRTVLRHAFLSFVFGTGIVAVMINVVAGLLR
jgi:uncharacterized membrane protein